MIIKNNKTSVVNKQKILINRKVDWGLISHLQINQNIQCKAMRKARGQVSSQWRRKSLLREERVMRRPYLNSFLKVKKMKNSSSN